MVGHLKRLELIAQYLSEIIVWLLLRPTVFAFYACSGIPLITPALLTIYMLHRIVAQQEPTYAIEQKSSVVMNARVYNYLLEILKASTPLRSSQVTLPVALPYLKVTCLFLPYLTFTLPYLTEVIPRVMSEILDVTEDILCITKVFYCFLR